jgi:putative NADPH-quinone reductase
MRLLVIYCHPCAESWAGAMKARLTEALAGDGHEITLVDLYGEGFAPAMPPAQRLAYDDPAGCRRGIEAHADRLAAAEGLLLVYPTWWYGMPAMLKGWFDRVWVTGIAFDVAPGGGISRAALGQVRRFAVVTSYGSPQWYIRVLVGDPGRKVAERGLRRLLAPGCGFSWNACYDMDRASPERLRRFAERAERRLRAFFRG